MQSTIATGIRSCLYAYSEHPHGQELIFCWENKRVATTINLHSRRRAPIHANVPLYLALAKNTFSELHLILSLSDILEIVFLSPLSCKIDCRICQRMYNKL